MISFNRRVSDGSFITPCEWEPEKQKKTMVGSEKCRKCVNNYGIQLDEQRVQCWQNAGEGVK